MTAARQDLDNTAALVEAAVRLLQQAKPVMERARGTIKELEPENPAVHTMCVIMWPIFRAAAELVRVHEFQMRLARAALEKGDGEMKSDIVDIDVTIHAESKRGESNAGVILVSLDGEQTKAVWLPKSAVEFKQTNPKIFRVTLPEWLALDKGLI